VTSPEFRPVDPEPGAATEPVPQPPAPQPVAFAQPVPGPAPTFLPVAPEPSYAAPPAPVEKAAKGTSNVLTAILVGAVLIAAVGVSFAVGRASSGTSGTVDRSATGAAPGGQAGGLGNGNGQGGGLGNGNGQGGPLTGRGPGASFDLNGGGAGGLDDDPDRGLGFDRGFGRGFGPGGLTGTVKAVDADSITIDMGNGQTVTFGLDGSTTYHQQVTASASDVKVGGTVEIALGQGFRPDQITRGDDGSITLGTAGNVTVVP
jgi:hypothetical protein